MPTAWTVRKIPRRPKCKCHVCTTNACKMRQMEPEEFRCMRGTVFDRGRSGPAGLNAAHVDALNDPAVCKQSRSRSADAPPTDKRAPEAPGAWQKVGVKKSRKRSPAPGDE